MSTRLLAASAANKKLPEGLLVTARAVYDALLFELSTAMAESKSVSPGAQPLIVPSRVSKIKNVCQPCTWNSPVCDGFHTTPVGNPIGPAPGAGGISTSNPCLTPAAL